MEQLLKRIILAALNISAMRRKERHNTGTRMLKKALCLTCLICLTLSVTAKAAVIDYGQYIYDPSNALYWLDLTATANMSYNEVYNRITNPNDVLWGWYFATGGEFEDLMGEYGASPMCDECDIHFFGWSADNNGVVEDVLADFGILGGGDGYDFIVSWGILDDQLAGDSRHYRAELYDSSPTMDMIYTHRNRQPNDYANPEIGSWLVRGDAPTVLPVPLPPALWLLGSGLIGLVGFRRKFKKA